MVIWKQVNQHYQWCHLEKSRCMMFLINFTSSAVWLKRVMNWAVRRTTTSSLRNSIQRERERALLDLRHFKAAKTGLNGDIYYAHTHTHTQTHTAIVEQRQNEQIDKAFSGHYSLRLAPSDTTKKKSMPHQLKIIFQQKKTALLSFDNKH